MSATEGFRTEETSDLLIVYTGRQRVTPKIYQRFFDTWAARLKRGERFGVVLVDEPFERSTNEGRKPAEEDAFTRVTGNFRRDYKELANRLTFGFSRVFPANLLAGMNDEQLALYRERSQRYAEYMYGVRGANFTNLSEAKAWLVSVADEAPLELGQMPTRASGTTGFYYGSTTGTTQLVAEKMQAFAKLAGITLEPVNISELTQPQELLAYSQLILGVPTWNVGQLQDDWLLLLPKLEQLDFSGKRVALFGLGDQLGYPDNFLDALGVLGKKLQERGANLVGRWSAEDYAFTHSKALVDDHFIGLGLDEYNQESKTDSRIAQWLGQVEREFGAAKRVLESV